MFSDPAKQASVISVTKLNRLARQVLESEVGQVWVAGEISNFTAAASGHWYFTLKDAKAQVRTCMFKGANRYIKQRPAEGDRVVVRAKLGLYEARGDYQLIAEHLEPEGVGQLKLAYEQLKQKLSAMGLFAMDAKKTVTQQATRIGIVTSPTGAAVHDILNVLKRRNPSINVVIYPCLVQGESAAQAIAQQIHIANQRAEVDVLIVGRGGGSLEDLWAFNEEAVAQAIYASDLPIVSAVGHEVDVTIADYVADVRAPTPSAAAELVSSDKAHVLQQVQQLQQKLCRYTQQLLRNKQHALSLQRATLNQNHPATKLQQMLQKADTLELTLKRSMQNRLKQEQNRAQKVGLQFMHHTPLTHITQQHTRTLDLQRRMIRAIRSQLDKNKQQLGHCSGMLNSVSPLAVLARGYSITRDSQQQVLKSTQNITLGDEISTDLHDGQLISSVKKILPN